MSFLDSLFGVNKAKAAASNAANQNRAESSSALGYAENLLNPYVQGGQQGYELLNNFNGVNGPQAQQNAYNNYVQGPDVQARLNQGIRTIDNSYAGRNAGTLSGGLLKSLTKYGTDVATQDLNSYLSRLQSGTALGQNAANTLTGARYNSAGLTTNANTAEGNAIANASLAGGNILGNIIGGAFGLAGSQGWNPFSGGKSGGGMAYGVRSNDPREGIR